MRRRITRTLLAAAAAGVTVSTLGFTAAGAASGAATGSKAFTPSGGTPIATNANCVVTPLPSDNCGMVGYEASARNFRFAQALITIPNHTGSVTTADPVLYVALDNSGTSTYQYTRVGIAPCPAARAVTFIVPGVSITCPTALAGNTSGWIAFTATADAGVTPVVTTHTISASAMGDGVLVNAYLTPTGNSVLTTITLPSGTTYHNSFAITGPVYTEAEANADWTTAIENGATAPQPAVPGAKIRDSQFFQGRFTTMNGTRGTFAGPWMVNAHEATSNGVLPPGGTLIGEPSSLWTNDGRPGDAFGVWRFPF